MKVWIVFESVECSHPYFSGVFISEKKAQEVAETLKEAYVVEMEVEE